MITIDLYLVKFRLIVQRVETTSMFFFSKNRQTLSNFTHLN